MRWNEQEYNDWLKRPSQELLEKKQQRINKQLEFNLQEQIANYIKYQYRDILWTASLGGMKVSIGVAKKMKRAGYQKGVPDLMIFCARKNYHGLFLELKIGKNKQTPEQREWQRKSEKEGYLYKIVYDFDEGKKIIDNYLKGIKWIEGENINEI